MIIIDHVGPLITAPQASQVADFRRFVEIFEKHLSSLRGVLAQRHTVWVIGNIGADMRFASFSVTLKSFAEAIRSYFSYEKVSIIELAVPNAQLDS